MCPTDIMVIRLTTYWLIIRELSNTAVLSNSLSGTQDKKGTISNEDLFIFALGEIYQASYIYFQEDRILKP